MDRFCLVDWRSFQLCNRHSLTFSRRFQFWIFFSLSSRWKNEAGNRLFLAQCSELKSHLLCWLHPPYWIGSKGCHGEGAGMEVNGMTWGINCKLMFGLNSSKPGSFDDTRYSERYHDCRDFTNYFILIQHDIIGVLTWSMYFGLLLATKK